jgi:hypothetical protein
MYEHGIYLSRAHMTYVSQPDIEVEAVSEDIMEVEDIPEEHEESHHGKHHELPRTDYHNPLPDSSPAIDYSSDRGFKFNPNDADRAQIFRDIDTAGQRYWSGGEGLAKIPL